MIADHFIPNEIMNMIKPLKMSALDNLFSLQ